MRRIIARIADSTSCSNRGETLGGVPGRPFWRLAPWIAAAAVAAAVLFAWGCGSGPGEAESRMTSYSSSDAKADSANLFSVPADQMAHIQLVTVEKERLPRVLRLTGSVQYNAFKTTPVISAVGGPVQEILAEPGQFVKAGQPLLTATSPDFADARAAYLKARSAFLLADKNYERAKDLFAHKAIAERDLQQAESDHAQAEADLESLVKNAASLGGRIPVPAPVSGQIVERLVGPGQLLQAGATQCFTISDMSTVWVLVNVYQSDLAYVHVGDAVEITTDAYPDTFHGKISYLAEALDPNTRTLQARIVTQNPSYKLKKDMYVSATVQAGAIRDALTVPDAAVLRDAENEPFVYVQSGPNEFARRPVKIGDSLNGRTHIIGGLQEGERVIGDGSLLLQFKNSLQH